jgi:hypothetical protein
MSMVEKIADLQHCLSETEKERDELDAARSAAEDAHEVTLAAIDEQLKHVGATVSRDEREHRGHKKLVEDRAIHFEYLALQFREQGKDSRVLEAVARELRAIIGNS